MGSWKEILPDANGLYGGLLCPMEQAHFIKRISSLSLLSGAFGLYRGYTDLGTAVSGVWLTSILFWSNPQYGWRRNLDMTYVLITLLYQCWKATQSEYGSLYYILTASAITCFPIGHYYHRQNRTWVGCYWHSGIHIIANIANVILYYGDIP